MNRLLTMFNRWATYTHNVPAVINAIMAAVSGIDLLGSYGVVGSSQFALCNMFGCVIENTARYHLIIILHVYVRFVFKQLRL